VDKRAFLDQFREFITVWFNDDEFLENDSIKVKSQKLTLKDFLDFYNPWYVDETGRAVGDIEQVLQDKSISILKVSQSNSYTKLWEREESSKPLITRPVIIATDEKIQKTLILDSNKTICRLIFKYNSSLTQTIHTCRISGPDLQKLSNYGDFKALHQRT
jgi:hypothetical protein